MDVDTSRSLRRLTRVTGGRGLLGLALAAAGFVTAVYVLTHGHPAYEGGLYLQIVREIGAHGYRLPERIPYYTEGGIPFAYPPLVFYVVAGVVDLTGVDPVALMRVVPGLVTVAYLVPFYALARQLLDSPRQAGFATLLFAVTPPVLRWHLSAGGLVRAPAMLLALLGLVVGVRLFRTGERRWVVPAALLWALTVLTHPVYTVFFGASYLLLFAAFDRSLRGLLHGAAVCLGGLLLASPWLLTVVANHGADIFTHASDSRTTLGGGGWRLLTQFVYPVTDLDASTPFYVAAYAGSAYALVRRRYLIALWTLAAAYLLGTPRFTFVAGSLASAMLVFEVVAPAAGTLAARLVGGRGADPDHPLVPNGGRAPPPRPVSRAGVRRVATVGVVLLLALGAVGVGGAYAGGALHTARGDSPALPQTVRPADRAAMSWAANHTSSEADFLVVGDEAEWFPYYAERTILVSPWGTEWTSPDNFRQEVDLYVDSSTCPSAACLADVSASVGQRPDYVYVPTRPYTVRGERYAPPEKLLDSLSRSERYRLRYATDGVAIFEVTDGPTRTVGTRRAPPPHSRVGISASRNAS